MNREISYQKILSLLANKKATCFEVADFYGVEAHVISGRFTELTNSGCIRISGTKLNKRFNPCREYAITAKGRQFSKQLSKKVA